MDIYERIDYGESIVSKRYTITIPKLVIKPIFDIEELILLVESIENKELEVNLEESTEKRSDKDKSADIMIFYQISDDKRICVSAGWVHMQGDELILGVSSASQTNVVSMPKNVRKLLKVKVGDIIKYWFHTDQRFRLEVDTVPETDFFFQDSED